jgi:hypothetical protein
LDNGPHHDGVRFANGAEVTLQELGPGVKGYIYDALLSPLWKDRRRPVRLPAIQVDVLETLDQWYGPDYRYIKARGTDGGLYILRFDEAQAEWELTMFKDARAQVRKDRA